MFEIGKKGTPGSRDEPSRERDDARTSAPAAPARSSASNASHREAAVIGPSIHIDGDLRGEEDLLIEGEVNGTVQLKSHSLTIGPHGKVRADVYANAIYVEGLMEGDLFGSERVAVRKTAQVRGNITAPHVSLEEGARFKGSIEMDANGVKAALGSPQTVAGSSPGAAKGAASMAAAGSDSGYKSGTGTAGATSKSGAAS
jgi:cytoskeletal protein CcmA (bactofilin family)